MASQNKDEPLKIYVGITCLPGREDNFEKCLNSFLNQSKLPEKVFYENYNRKHSIMQTPAFVCII